MSLEMQKKQRDYRASNIVFLQQKLFTQIEF